MELLCMCSGPRTWTHWLRRMGWAGFLFFLIKGLAWLAALHGFGGLFAG